jgi:SAM-dependent methyltransferase
MLIPYPLMYRLGLAPWERRSVARTWDPILEGQRALPPGRALDVGCGGGRDAVHLANHGWQVTAVDSAGAAIARARQRAAQEGADVEWITGDVSDLPGLGLKPGYTLIYDFGCVQGLPDTARQRAAAGITALAAPGATLLVAAFAPGRRVLLPRGMSEEDVKDLFGAGWTLEAAEPAADPSLPAPVRRARPTGYRLRRKDTGADGPAS